MPDQPHLFADRVLAEIPVVLHTALQAGATLLVSVSGGADSDAMAVIVDYLHRRQGWPGELYLLHAHLGRMDWRQTLPHVHDLARRLRRPVHIAQRRKGDLLARFWERLESLKARGKPLYWISDARNRFCTADAKRGPLDILSRKLIPAGTAVSAIGIRAAESRSRSERSAFTVRTSLTTKSRKVYDWLPLFNFSREEVWATLGTSSEELAQLRAQASQMRATHTPDEILQWAATTGFAAHVAYIAGSTRLSCALCPLARRHDLEVGAHFNPSLFRDLVRLEVVSGGIRFQAHQALHAIRPDLLDEELKAALGYSTDDLNSPYQIALL